MLKLGGLTIHPKADESQAKLSQSISATCFRHVSDDFASNINVQHYLEEVPESERGEDERQVGATVFGK